MTHDRGIEQLAAWVMMLAGAAGVGAQSVDGGVASAVATFRQVVRIDAEQGAAESVRVESPGPAVSHRVGELAEVKVWQLGPGQRVTIGFDLPEGSIGESARVTLVGVENAAEQRQARVTINGAEAIVLAVPAAESLATLTIPSGGQQLRAGPNQLDVTTGDGVSAGLVAVEVSYRLEYPSGEGLNIDHLPPLPWDGSHGEPNNPTAREAQHEARLERVRNEQAPVRLTLLSPRAGALFDTAGGVTVEWLAEGFPAGSGVALHYRAGDGGWQVIEGAEDLPFNHPSGTGDRGSFTWKPAEPLEGVRIGLGYVRTAKRRPVRVAVGPDQPFKTLGEALEAAYHGDTIVLSAGVYGESVTLYHDVRIIGADREGCVLSPTESRAIVVASGVRASIENLTIDGAARMRDHEDVWAVHAPGSTVAVRDVTIRNAVRGIVVNWPGGEGALSNISMEGTTYGLTATRGARVTLTDAAITLAGDDVRGVLIDQGGSVKAERVRIIGTARLLQGVGFGVWGAGSKLDATDCGVYATNTGFYVSDSGAAQLANVHAAGLVEGQPVKDAMEYALDVGEGGSVTVSSSELAHCFNPCVSVRSGGKVALTGSKVHHSAQAGMLVHGAGVADVRMTEFTDSYNGVKALSGSKVTVMRGTFRRNSAGFAADEGSEVSISDSDASDNRAWGYYGPGIDRSNRGSNNGNGTYGPR